MSIRKVSFAQGEYYHIYNRGNDKRIIFHDDQDYKRFVTLLYLCNSINRIDISEIKKDFFIFERGKNITAIGAYCLMPNHFHLVLTQLEDNGISKFMQKITTAYSMYYNKKYKRTGGLFEGKFKSQHLNDDRYLKYLFSYIHLNPIKLIQKDWKEVGIRNIEKALVFLNKYKYSSYKDYMGINREENIILDKKAFPDYFPNKKSFAREVFEWLSFKSEGKTFR